MLTKSDYLKYLQCRKCLWLHKKRKDLAEPFDDVATERFAVGAEVERYANRLFPDGVAVEADSFRGGLDQTSKMMRGGVTLFQPSFLSGELYCRCDILRVDESGGFDLIEVKSSTSVKEEHGHDLAFQRLVLERCGLRFKSASVIHLNRDYVRHGDVDPNGLLMMEDVTEVVAALQEVTQRQVAEALAVLDLPDEPTVKILRQCHAPHDCPFVDYCWRDVPERSIYETRLSAEELSGLLDESKVKLQDVSATQLSHGRDLRHWAAVRTGQAIVDVEGLSEWLGQLIYPIYCLDYETYSAAIPALEGFRPYERLPFQFSVHVIDQPGTPARHFEFLADELTDTTEAVTEALAKAIGGQGTALAWYMNFERGCNEEMAERRPAAAALLTSINERMVDLMQPFAEGLYVHPDFGNSASLKAVVPVLAPELSYADLEIGNGGEATLAWPEMTAPTTLPERRTALRRQLLDYCGRDTAVMVRILEVLRAAVEPSQKRSDTLF